MKKSIAIFLNGPIKNDSRVQKTIISLSKLGLEVDLYCVADNLNKIGLFDYNVHIIESRNSLSLVSKILARTFFTRQYYFSKLSFKQPKKNYDFVWANDLPCLHQGYKCAMMCRAKLIYDSHEIYLETINQFFPRYVGKPKKWLHDINIKLMRAIGKRDERKYGRKADLILTVNDSLKRHFLKVYGWKNIAVLPNAPMLNSRIIPKNLKKLFSLDDNSIIVLYQGSLNEGRGLFQLIESLSHLGPNYCILILGDGVIMQDLKLYATKLGLKDRVIFAGMLAQDELLNYTAGADLGINLLEKFNLSKYLASPNKLYEYVYAGIPVLCTASPESLKILNEFKIGQTTELQAKSIAGNIEDIIENFQLDPNVISAFKAKYNWKNQSDAIFSEILGL